MTGEPSFEGRCACGALRYRMNAVPMFVHACHCSECQRLSGSAFALNALVEADRLEILSGTSEPVAVPGSSGRPQIIHRCARCQTALWSHYPGAGPRISFVRVGTLEQPERLPPDIHIYTSSRLPWLALADDARAVPEYYSREAEWPPDALERWRRVKEG
jgi:hypothetical protein